MMKTAIYYFSATGNSLSIAKKLSREIKNSTITSIPQAIAMNEEISADVIGIVCPIYFHNMPHIVREFIQKITKASYIFMVYAGAGDLGLCIKRTKQFFHSQNLELSSVFSIAMPDNSTLHVKSEKEQKGMLYSSNQQIEKIIEIVNGKKSYFDENTSSLYQTYVHPGILCKMIYKDVPKMDKDFKVNDNCTGCGTCQKVCPVNNIRIKDKKPLWNVNHKCEACLACYNWCPKKSISHKSVNTECKRYQNPNIHIKEIIKSAK